MNSAASSRKGEKGIMILAPIRPAQNRGKRKTLRMTRRVQLLGSGAAYVFDIRQTDGKELPQIGTVEGNPYDYSDRLRQFATAQGLPSNTR